MLDPTQRIGAQIAGRYRLDALIGAGGMGVVYRGVHLWTGREVAVKLLSTDRSDVAYARFLREARAAASVRHPHLVEVIDVGEEDDGTLYLVLELLEGESLRAHLERKGTLRPDDALDVVVPILDALEALHRAGVVHRDVKPDNIFLALEGGRVTPKLLDLGISKPLERGDAALTRTGSLIGTPAYMSPEQARGAREVGVGADVWATGVVLYECLRGEPPFSADTIAGILHQIATRRAPSLVETTPDLPREIAAAVDAALAADASARHASAEAFADALVNAALAAGWPLTCRMPSGPRISLEPGLGSRDTDESRAPPSGSSISLEPTIEAPERATPTRESDAPAKSDAPAASGGITESDAIAAPAEREVAPASVAPTEDAVLPLRPRWPALAALVAVALVAGAVALAYGGRDAPTEAEAPARPPEPEIAAGPPETAPLDAAAAPLDAGAAPLDAGTSSAEPDAGVTETPQQRTQPRTRPRVDPSRPVPLGPNSAPIIVD